MEKTPDTRSQILGSDLQILHVCICKTHGKCACDGLLRCTVLMPLFAVDRVGLVTFGTKVTKGRSDRRQIVCMWYQSSGAQAETGI